jgi:hypothetical protein
MRRSGLARTDPRATDRTGARPEPPAMQHEVAGTVLAQERHPVRPVER